jgi:hypothetical protein
MSSFDQRNTSVEEPLIPHAIAFEITNNGELNGLMLVKPSQLVKTPLSMLHHLLYSCVFEDIFSASLFGFIKLARDCLLLTF